jgi:hypothetical protein
VPYSGELDGATVLRYYEANGLDNFAADLGIWASNDRHKVEVFHDPDHARIVVYVDEVEVVDRPVTQPVEIFGRLSMIAGNGAVASARGVFIDSYYQEIGRDAAR